VRDVDYAAARPFWHADIIVFGTYKEVVRGLTAWTETQWNNVWREPKGLRSILGQYGSALQCDGSWDRDRAWTSTGFGVDGCSLRSPRQGDNNARPPADGRWLGVHSHRSLQRGVPQESHGKRPVRARLSGVCKSK